MVRPVIIDETIGRYVADHSEPLSAVQLELVEATSAATGQWAGMQIGADQAAFMRMLTRLIQPTLAVEIGTFTGMSALAIATGLGPEGRLLCCDISEEWTAIARTYWAKAGIADRIDLVIAPAKETLAGLAPEIRVDLAFIDADKEAYVDYYEALIPRLSANGVVLVDNTLWSGRVADPEADDSATVALRAFNEHVAADERTEAVILSIGDGVTMITAR